MKLPTQKGRLVAGTPPRNPPVHTKTINISVLLLTHGAPDIHPHIIVSIERDSICPALTDLLARDPRYNLMGVLRVRYYTLRPAFLRISQTPTKPTRPMQTLLIEIKVLGVIIVSKDRESRLHYLLHDDRIVWGPKEWPL